MKKVILSLVAFVALIIASCSSDPCKDKSALTQCTGNGTLVDNNGNCECDCNNGYEGSNCTTLSLTKYVGDWKLASTAILGQSQNVRTGNTNISQTGTSFTRVQITNLNQFFGCTNGGTTADVICYADIKGDELILDNTVQCGYSFDGKGVIQADGSILFTYKATHNGETYECNSTLTK